MEIWIPKVMTGTARQLRGEGVKICLMVYKCLHGLAPQYLIDCLSRLDNPRDLRSSGNTQLRVPKARVKLGEGAFSVCGPTLWNKLPPFVRSTASVDIFKCRLKNKLSNKLKTYQKSDI